MVTALAGGSLLGGGSLLPTSTSSLSTTRIAERMYTDMRKKTDAVQLAYQSDLDPLNARLGSVAGRLSDAEDIQVAVENGETQVKEIRQLLLDLRVILSSAERNPDHKDFYAAQFNGTLTEINKVADRYADAYNLLGRPDPETLAPAVKTLQVEDFGVDLEFQGLYAGSSFNLVGTGDSDGTTYQNEPTVNLMQAVTDPGGEELEGTIGHDSDRISAVAVNGESISFTLDGTDSFTGTLEQGGIGLMPAWFYDGFTDLDAASAAVAEAESALEEVSLNLANIGSRITPIVDRLTREKEQVTGEIATLRGTEEQEIAAIENETRRQFTAVENSLKQSSGDIARYKSILAPLNRGPFADLNV
ncbi:hypothetical protein [Roseospira goensis]|uniref:Flagellin n=1 Tax=Roseospira goensis TaxID=391922 RepID=A0A7W6WJ54_9PROT|nr:hypothetical protein [Roseospira goensis]MBB4284851.1 hypothetical protein [Roseospira goensis]